MTGEEETLLQEARDLLVAAVPTRQKYGDRDDAFFAAHARHDRILAVFDRAVDALRDAA